MPKKLLLVDAPNHAFRAYHAIQNDMRAPDGFPTRALYGFTRMLLALMRDQKPDYVALVFDNGKSFRNDLFPDYKGQRPDMPEDLRQQWGELAPLARAFGFHVISERNTEADDIIGTLAVRFGSPDVHVGIVSGDKDFCQLVNEHIHIVDLMKGVELDPPRVVEKWGVPPERIIDLLSLMGDTADNVPGVPGVGEKKAAQYINKYGDLESVLAKAGEIGGKTGQAIADNAAGVRLAKQLVTIHTGMPVDATLADLEVHARDEVELATRLTRYNFKSLLTELKLDPAAAAKAPTPAGEAESTLQTPAEAEVVWGPKPLAALAAQLRAAGRFAIDVQTAPHAGDLPSPAERPVRVLFAWEAAKAVRLALVPWTAGAATALRGVLEDTEVGKTGYDLKTAWKALAAGAPSEERVTLAGIDGEVGIADYLRAPEQKRALDDLCRRWLEAPLGTHVHDPVLAAWLIDARLTRELAEWNAARVYREVDLPILPVLARMELAGIGVDAPALEKLGVELDRRLTTMVKEIHDLAGETFNVNSTQQLAVLLFEKLQLKGGKKTKTGWSTDRDTLDKLRDQHPLPGAILAYRELFKLKGTYVDALPKTVAADGRIHTTFDQTVAATGRLSSNDPNLQNIPVRSEEGRRIRTCFIAKPGHVFLSADYSQIELRILAHYCAGGVQDVVPVSEAGGGPLVESFLRGEDIHRRTASEIFGVNPALVTADQRRAAKAINFGIVYGMGASRLANDLRIPRAEAQAYIDGYFARLPQVKAYMNGAIARARETGYAETLYGRRRPVAGLDAGNPMDRANAEREAINTPIQGSAADLIKIAMTRVDRALHGTGARLLLQVHDELVLEVPEGEVADVRARVIAAMEGVASLAVPLVVETGVSADWGGAH